MTNEGFRRGDVFMAELRAEPGSVEHGRSSFCKTTSEISTRPR